MHFGLLCALCVSAESNHPFKNFSVQLPFSTDPDGSNASFFSFYGATDVDVVTAFSIDARLVLSIKNPSELCFCIRIMMSPFASI